MGIATEVEKLLSTICQGGQIKIEGGHLFVSPPEIARKFGDQIKRLKPEILIALGHCPVCTRELVVKVEEASSEKTARHAYCSGQEILHYDSWKF
jgi:hypothetical protein